MPLCIHETLVLKGSLYSLLVSALQGGENAQLPLYWSCWKRECDYDVYLSLPVYLCRRAGGLRSGKRTAFPPTLPVFGMPPTVDRVLSSSCNISLPPISFNLLTRVRVVCSESSMHIMAPCAHCLLCANDKQILCERSVESLVAVRWCSTTEDVSN